MSADFGVEVQHSFGEYITGGRLQCAGGGEPCFVNTGYHTFRCRNITAVVIGKGGDKGSAGTTVFHLLAVLNEDLTGRAENIAAANPEKLQRQLPFGTFVGLDQEGLPCISCDYYTGWGEDCTGENAVYWQEKRKGLLF